ncbi:MAG: septum formation protein Maf [Acidobacteria bacterium]|nr:septum formation protein Maf [Acidobacteriota bacterium]MBK8809388.1 septum formation protein Maf [Acidobacteriota bacterium]
MKLPKLILASGSPRRAEILQSVGWLFEKESADIDESERPGESPNEYVMRLALEKAGAVASKYADRLVLGADTTVVIDDQIVGKPIDLDDARRMIRMLAGNWHAVLTGVALVSGERSAVGLQRTEVKFAAMSEREVEFLVEFGEPLDKAGAYAVQAQAALFIEEIRGDYWNVVGLPVNLVYGLAAEVLG